MTETPSDMRAGTWQVPECPFLIEYSPAMLDEIRLAAVDAFFSVPRGGVEIGGVLFGSRVNGGVRVTAFRPMQCEHATGPAFVLSGKDRTCLQAQLAESEQDPLLRGLEIVGWYHSHTRSEIFLSALDLEIYDEFFPDPWRIALVMRPDGMKPTRAGFFFRDGDGKVHNAASYHEFIVDAASDRRAVAEPAPASPRPAKSPAEESAVPPAAALTPRPETVPAGRGEDVAPEIERHPAEFVPPAFMIVPERSGRRLAMWLALVLAAAGGAAWFTSGYWLKGFASKPVYLHLQALDREGQLNIQWDQRSLDSPNVQGGALEIVDGASATTIPLDAARLRGGTYQYVRRTEIVSAHLIVRIRQGSPLEEFTTFYGQPPKPASSDLAHEKQNLELARARADLKQQELRSLELQRSLDQMRLQMRRDEESKRVEPGNPSAGSAPATAPSVAETINSTAPPPDRLPAAAQPERLSLSGRWAYSRASKSRSPFPPESVTLVLKESNNRLRGTLSGRYKVPKGQKGNPRANFNFDGPLHDGLSKFPFTAADGSRGEIELLRLPGKKDAIKVMWRSERDKLTFDDTLFRIPQ